MKGGSSRGGSSSKKNKKSRASRTQTPITNPFNAPGYYPQAPSPQINTSPYFYNQGFPMSQQFNAWGSENQFQDDFPFHPEQPNLQDYREVDVEDSDSSDPPHEQPSTQKIKGKGKAPSKRWTDEEEIALCRAWLICSSKGNNMKRDGFYKMVTDEFCKIMKDYTRNFHQIYSKWGDLNAAMKKWNGIYQQAAMKRVSGEGESQISARAHSIYKETVKSKGFDHINAWEVVRNEPLWCDIPPAGHESVPTSKRSKTHETMGSGNAYFEEEIQGGQEEDEVQHDRDGDRVYYEPERPSRRGKISAASSSSHEELIRNMGLFTTSNQEDTQHRMRLREEKINLMKEEKEARISLIEHQKQQADMQFFIQDHSNYVEPMLSFILDRKREIAAKWGWQCPF